MQIFDGPLCRFEELQDPTGGTFTGGQRENRRISGIGRFETGVSEHQITRADEEFADQKLQVNAQERF